MSYKKQHERKRELKSISREAEASAGRVVANLRDERRLEADQVVPDAALISEAFGYFPPGSPLIERYLGARLDGAGNSEEERDSLVGELLLKRNSRWRAEATKAQAMQREAEELLRHQLRR